MAANQPTTATTDALLLPMGIELHHVNDKSTNPSSEPSSAGTTSDWAIPIGIAPMAMLCVMPARATLACLVVAVCGCGAGPRSEETTRQLPAQVSASHEGLAWTVYVAYELYDSPEFSAARRRIQELGYPGHYADLGCDHPVDPMPDLEAPGDRYLFALYFERESEARAVASEIGDVLWIGRVQTFCAEEEVD